MAPSFKAFAATLLAGLALADPVAAKGYETTRLDDAGSFTGCVVANDGIGLGFLGTPETFSILARSTRFSLSKDQAITGTWNVDDNKRVSFSTTGGSNAQVVDIELKSAEQMALVSNGDELVVNVGKASATFDLAGSAKAVADLTACMKKADAGQP